MEQSEVKSVLATLVRVGHKASLVIIDVTSDSLSIYMDGMAWTPANRHNIQIDFPA